MCWRTVDAPAPSLPRPANVSLTRSAAHCAPWWPSACSMSPVIVSASLSLENVCERPAFDHVFGMSAWEYRTQHPELAVHFHLLMASRTSASAAALAKAYDFAPFHTAVDVGGGNGTLLTAILWKHAHLCGILFEETLAIDAARPLFLEAGVAHRFDAIPGDFFVSVPDGGDVYLLKSILHDWSDEPSVAILRNCWRVMPPHGRLLLVEHVLTDEISDAPAVVHLDLQMLVMLGGRQRR